MMLIRFGLVPINSKVVNLGDVFGRLTVVAVGQKKPSRKAFAICKCSCGSGEKAVRYDALLTGVTTSCGCFHRQQITTHGLTKSPHYKRWWHMLSRCNDSKDQAYKDYGGRGIKVCDQWLDVTQFISDLPDGYFEGAEIDRIDNDGNYEPGNVRWATSEENSDNRRSARLLTFNGKTLSLSRWASELGLNKGTLKSRIDDSGWSIEKALTTPTMSDAEVRRLGAKAHWDGHTAKQKPKPKALKSVMYKDRLHTVRELSEMCGVSVKLLRKRLFERGWPVDRAVIK